MGGMKSPITVTTRGGEKVKVYFDLVKGSFENVYLEGKAQLVYGILQKQSREWTARQRFAFSGSMLDVAILTPQVRLNVPMACLNNACRRQ